MARCNNFLKPLIVLGYENQIQIPSARLTSEARNLRTFFFRFAAATLGILFVWAFFVVGFDKVTLAKRIMLVPIAAVFLVYGFVGERAADFVLGLTSGTPRVRQRSRSNSAGKTEATKQSNDNQS